MLDLFIFFRRSIYHFDPDNLPLGCQPRSTKAPNSIEETNDETTACTDMMMAQQAQQQQLCDEYAEEEEDDDDEDETNLCVDSQCNENNNMAPPPLMYTTDMYASAVDVHMHQTTTGVDGPNNMQNFNMSCEVSVTQELHKLFVKWN